MKKTFLALSVLLLSASAADAQQRERGPRDLGGGYCEDNVYNCAETPNPLPEPNTVWVEEMTWMDVRDALDDGVKTVIISTGGVEPHGPTATPSPGPWATPCALR